MSTRKLTRPSGRLGVAALLLVPALAACGGDDDGPSVAEPPEVSASEDTEATEDSDRTATEGSTAEDDAADTTTQEPTTQAPTEGVTEEPTDGDGDGGDGEAAVESGAETPEAAAEQFFRAMGENDGERACLVMTDETGQAAMADDPMMLDLCTVMFDELTQDFSEAQRLALGSATINDATIDGDTATIDASNIEGSGPGVQSEPVTLVRIGDRWYFDASQAL